MNLYQFSKYFLKLAALEWPEETKWVPKDFKEKQIFKDYPFKNAIKIFKKFGLNDFRTPVKIENTKELKNDINTNLKNQIIIQLDICRTYLFDYNLHTLTIANDIIKFRNYLAEHEFTINIVEDIKSNNKTLFPKGMSIFKIYQKIKNNLDKLEEAPKLPNLDKLDVFKNYSNVQKPEELELVFSTQIGDIAGMSDRGIKSCQTLDEKDPGDYNQCVVGSILSKYLGICYLTNKSNWKDRGEKMLYRSLIRFVINIKENKPYIFIAKLYPEKNENVINVIKQELQKRSKIPVVTASDIKFDDFYLRKEKNIPKNLKSYQDAGEKFTEQKLSIKKLIKQLFDPSYDIRSEAFFTLMENDQYSDYLENKDLISVILTSPYKDIRQRCAAKLSLPLIISLRRDKDPEVRKVLASRIGHDEYPEFFRKLMIDESSMVISELFEKYDFGENITLNLAKDIDKLNQEQKDKIFNSINQHTAKLIKDKISELPPKINYETD